MTFEAWLVFGHILSAMVWVGGSLMLCMVAARARRSDDPNAVAEFTRTLTFLGPRIMLPAVLGTLLFGVWLVLRSPSWGFDQHWVQAGAGLFLLALAVGAIYMSRIGIALQRGTTNGAPAAESRRHGVQAWRMSPDACPRRPPRSAPAGARVRTVCRADE